MNNSTHLSNVPEESEAMREIREVRSRIQAETENMTPEERSRYYEEGSRRFEELAAKIGIEDHSTQVISR